MNPAVWRAVSAVLLLVFVVAFVVTGFDPPRWAWIAFLLSGVAFAVELALVAARRRRAAASGPREAP